MEADWIGFAPDSGHGWRGPYGRNTPFRKGKRDEMIEINVKVDEETEASADVERKDIKT